MIAGDLSQRMRDGPGRSTGRSTAMGRRYMVAAGNYLAAEAAFQVLETGGNAVDAGIAAGLTLGVVHSDLVNIAGVAPILIYVADRQEVVAISGVGVWPRAASSEFFRREYEGEIPTGILRTVVPAAPDAWITALKRYGTASFAEVAAPAIQFARDGFEMYPLMAEIIATFADSYRQWPSSASVYLPDGIPPPVGSIFVQSDLARTLQYMVDQERVGAKKGRRAGLEAAHEAFYAGDIGRTIVAYHEANGGWLSMADMKAFKVSIEEPVVRRFRGIDVYTGGAWCQGPVLLQTLGLIGGFDLAAMGHNSTAYIHILTEAMKLAFADREYFFGDPHFVDVPLDHLLNDEYAARRRRLIQADRAWPELPPRDRSLDEDVTTLWSNGVHRATRDPSATQFDTSYVAVIDGDGNAFSATPSDVSFDTPVIPGTGLCPSSRGSQSWTDPDHPSVLAPGKRPRLTPSPAIAIDAAGVMPFGSPGGDVQTQAMLQALLNIEVFGMEFQEAVEAPRFATLGFPESFAPHLFRPALLKLEPRIGTAIGEELQELGHDIEWWPDSTWRAGAVCLARSNRRNGILSGAADPRRPSYALGR